MRPFLVLGQPDYDRCLPAAPGPNRLNNILGVAVDASGVLYVADNGSNRIAVFRPPLSNFMNAAAVLGQNDFTSFSALAFDKGGIADITDLALDSQGDLWVAHNGFFISVYHPPYSTGQIRNSYFDYLTGPQAQVGFPYKFSNRYQRIRFSRDWGLWFSGPGLRPWLTRILPPVLSPLGVLNAASFSYGPLSPGQFTTAFGTQLGFVGGLVSTLDAGGRLGTALGKTQVYVNDSLVPIYYADFNQVNFLMPFDLDTNRPAKVQVATEGIRSSPVLIPTGMVNPQVFVLGSGNAAIVNHDYVVGHLSRGKFGVAFVTGLGAVTGVIDAGQIVPPALFPTASPVSVTINGFPCKTLFSGLAPGSIGQYQVNFEVPTDLPPAPTYQLVLIQGFSTSKPVTVAVP
jgi:uncharacterized protein (TIGR03437 family)